MASESVAIPSPFHSFSELALRDEMDKLLLQSRAALLNTYGGSGSGFRGMNESDQDAYMFMVHEMISRVESVWTEIDQRRNGGEIRS